MNETPPSAARKTQSRRSLARWLLVGVSVLACAAVYLSCIHMLGFPDGHISPFHRIRRAVAYAFIGWNALVVVGVFLPLRPHARHQWTLLAVHAVVSTVLLGLILYFSRPSFVV